MSNASENAAAPAAGSSKSKPVSDYIGKAGGLILVVGGGMSVPTDLAELTALGVRPSVIVSANGHAVRAGLKPDYVVCKDDRHTETGESMEALLRPIGAPIVSPQPWADIRLDDWPFQGNSGLHAILFAVLLGGQPVVPIGFDFYTEGTHWHDPDAKNVSRGRALGLATAVRRAGALAAMAYGVAIRPLSGPLLRIFPRYSPRIPLPPRELPEIVRHYQVYRGETRRERDRRILRRPRGS